MKFLPYVLLIEVGMTVFLAYIILYTYDRRTGMSFKEKSIVLLVLVMMGSMLNSFAYYLASNRDFLSTIIAVNISMIAMSVALLTLLLQYATEKNGKNMKRNFASTFAVLLIYNEISMGVFVYALAFGYSSILETTPAVNSFIDILSLGVNSFLFILPMVAEMSIFFFLRPVHGTHRIVLLSLLTTAVVSPTIAGNYLFTQAGSLIVLSAMVAFVIILIDRMVKGSTSEEKQKRLPWIFPIFFLMMAGTLIGTFYDGNFASKWAIYGASMVWGMTFYFVYSLTIDEKIKAGDSNVKVAESI